MKSSNNLKTQISVLLALLTAICMTSAPAQYCKWVDETGCVHYAEKCPQGVEAEKVEIQEKPCTEDIKTSPPKLSAAVPQKESSDEAMQKASERLLFESVKRMSQLAGCWEKIQPSADMRPNPNKIEIYPFEEPKYQYFCFESARKLYTYMTTKKPGDSPREIKKQATMMPSVERYSIPREGIVRIEHLDAGTRLYWVTSVAKVVDVEDVYGMRTGDLFMTLRHAKTGEDLYFRHLRKID